MSAFITYTKHSNYATITLNRADKFNSFVREMALAMLTALDDFEQDASMRALYLTGTGKAFCAGQDLGEVIDPNGPPISDIVSQHYNPMVMRIRTIEKPIVCGVNGVAAGAGANIALACDVVVAAESASFIQAFSKIGLIPDSGGTYTLPRIIGMGKASALMLLGDKITATDAEKMGMIYQVVPNENLETVGLTLTQTLANMPTVAIGLTKRALNASANNTLEQQLKLEDELQTLSAQSHDYNEGVSAFVEKRAPKFTGK
ncbi:MAG: enoyl-CoA hydratase-related protein [Bacteroidia bacterium]